MGLFSNKYNGVNQFEDMRHALNKPESNAGPSNVAADDQSTNGSLGSVDQLYGASPATGDSTGAEAARSREVVAADSLSIVSAGSSWQGTLKIEGSARIDGELNGEIEARDTVHISENARVNAKIKAGVVVIAGTFEGQVDCSERLELMPMSQIRGELSTKALRIHEGAYIDGQIKMTDQARRSAAHASGSAKTKTVSPAASSAPVGADAQFGA